LLKQFEQHVACKMPLGEWECMGFSFSIPLPVTLTHLLLHCCQLFALLEAWEACLLVFQGMLDCLRAPFRRAFGCTNIKNKCLNLLLPFAPPWQDLHKVAEILLVSFVTGWEHILCSTNLLSMRQSTTDDVSMWRKLWWANTNDFEKSFESSLSSIKFELARKEPAASGMSSLAPVSKIPGAKMSADSNSHFESGDPVHFLFLTDCFRCQFDLL
jgi:hypothetical protein